MHKILKFVFLSLLAQTFGSPAFAQQLPPMMGGNPVVLDAEEALRQGAPPSVTHHSLNISKIDLSLNQDERGQWHAEASDGWRFRGTGGEVLLELFPGEVLWMRGTRIEDAEDASSWIGEVLLPEPGVAIITRTEEGVYGTFEVGNHRYALVTGSGQDGQVFAKQVDNRDIGKCLIDGKHDGHEHHKRHQPPAWASKAITPKSGGGSTSLDILFLYTPGAATYMGTPSPFINNLVASLNSAFFSSGVTGSARAVYYGQQSGISSLNTVEDFYNVVTAMHNGASVFNNLAALRDAHSADLVVLLVDRTIPSQICGMAGDSDLTPLHPLDLFTGSDQKAYAVVSVNCADDDRTFHHEVGHLLGGWHDLSSINWGFNFTGTCGIGNGSCGYTDDSNEFRTIMGSGWDGTEYECNPSGCPRLLRFSDWDQTAWVNGGWRALGKVQGNRQGHENFVATLNGEEGRTATIPWVAAYRTPTGSPPSAPTLVVDTCYSVHLISWSAVTGSVGWFEVQISDYPSHVPTQDVYRGGESSVSFPTLTPFYTRARACNATGCSTWTSRGPADPTTCG